MIKPVIVLLLLFFSGFSFCQDKIKREFFQFSAGVKRNEARAFSVKNTIFPGTTYELNASFEYLNRKENFDFSIGIKFNSFANRFYNVANMGGNTVEFGSGPNRINYSEYYSFFGDYVYGLKINKQQKFFITAGPSVSFHRIKGQYDYNYQSASTSNSSVTIAHESFTYRTTRVSYSIQMGIAYDFYNSEKKHRGFGIKLLYNLGINDFNRNFIRTYENGVKTDEGEVWSEGSGFYIGLTWKWLKGGRVMRKLQENK